MKKVLLSVLTLLTISGNSIAQNLPSYLPANGLVGWWPFNGNANDESGNNNNGTVNGATLSTDRFGNVGSAYDFDSGSLISIPNSNSLNPASITMNAWVFDNGSSPGNYRYILTKVSISSPSTEFSYSLHIVPNQAIAAHYGVGLCGQQSGFNPERPTP